MAQITINEGLAWLKTLKKRHEELLALRNDNAHRERRFYGASADKEIVKEPVYDVKVLDKLVTRVARDTRLLEQALKTTNAKTMVDGRSRRHGAGRVGLTRKQRVWGRPEGRAVERGPRRAFSSAVGCSCGSGSQPTISPMRTPTVLETDPR